MPPLAQYYLAVSTREDEPLPELDPLEIHGRKAAGNMYAWSDDGENDQANAKRRFVRVPGAQRLRKLSVLEDRVNAPEEVLAGMLLPGA